MGGRELSGEIDRYRRGVKDLGGRRKRSDFSQVGEEGRDRFQVLRRSRRCKPGRTAGAGSEYRWGKRRQLQSPKLGPGDASCASEGRYL